MDIRAAINLVESFSEGTVILENLIVWHGSPKKHSLFSADHIGSGEGAASFGWGLYFATSKNVAEYYRDHLAIDGVGYLYQVDIPKNNAYILWDEPLSKQPAVVKAFARKHKIPTERNSVIKTGAGLYRWFAKDKGSDRAASQ